MGFFGTYAYEHGVWTELPEGQLKEFTEPWLWIDIHDSDITSVVYAPIGSGTGVAYLGLTPRTYFENDNASDPTDVAREAKGLAEWWAAQAQHADADQVAKEQELAGYLAKDENPDEWEEDIDESEVFVEVKTLRFLAALGLPQPYALT